MSVIIKGAWRGFQFTAELMRSGDGIYCPVPSSFYSGGGHRIRGQRWASDGWDVRQRDHDKGRGGGVMCKCNCVQSMRMRNVHLSRSKGCDYCRAERRLLCKNLGANGWIGSNGEQFASL